MLVDVERTDPATLPIESAISTVTLAELAAGPHATTDPNERARRQDRLQRAESEALPLPVDVDVARAYGRAYAAVSAGGRKIRGRRGFDLLIAATAIAAGLPLYTRNPDDFAGLADLLEIVTVRPAAASSEGKERVGPSEPKGN